jgi:hypothetical protein
LSVGRFGGGEMSYNKQWQKEMMKYSKKELIILLKNSEQELTNKKTRLNLAVFGKLKDGVLRP